MCAALLALGVVAVDAHASVVIGGTRVIFNGEERETTVKLTNDGKVPALTQVWIDKGDQSADPSVLKVPFMLTPPISRIDPGKGQTLRVLFDGQPLPADKESVFWLNVLEVPPKPGAEMAGVNTLSLAYRTRIKLFYRPSGLKGVAQEAPAKVTWRVVRDGGKVALEASNPTQYFVSFSSVELVGGAGSVEANDGGMVGPGETARFALKGDAPATAGTVRFRAINDWGGPVDGQTSLNPNG